MRFLFLLLLSIASVNCTTLQDTVSEIRAIATARAQFNEGWMKYINEGRFNQDDTEVASQEESMDLYIDTFIVYIYS